MKKYYLVFIMGILLIGMMVNVSANIPRTISENDFNTMINEAKSCIYPEEYWTLDASKKVKGDQFENKIDLLCILITARADKIKVQLLEQKVSALEQKVADLENIIYNTKGTTIITEKQNTTKMWWEFWK